MESSWTNRAENKALRRVKVKSNILHTADGRKTDWIGHTLRRNCHLKHFIERKMERSIEVTGRIERRSQHLLDDIEEKATGN
jgi:hypothetical protein